jgi:hypothetical protein
VASDGYRRDRFARKKNMSYVAASTRNLIGMRSAKTRLTLGVHRAPAEMIPNSGLFSTHLLSGFGAAAPAAIPVPAGYPTTEAYIDKQGFVWEHGKYGNAGWSMTDTTATLQRSFPTQHPYTDSSGNIYTYDPSSSSWKITNTVATPKPYTDSFGNSWTYNKASGWSTTGTALPGLPGGPTSANQQTPTPQISTPASPAPGSPALTSGAAATAQAGTPVPVGYPTTQAYVDSQGNIWTNTPAGGWQATGTTATTTPAAAEAAALQSAAGGTTVNVTGADMWATITNWLQAASIIPNVPNFWLVAAAGAGALLLWPKGKR